MDDFADFTTFGIATSLLLRTPDFLDNVLCMCYVMSVFVRLCFFSSGKRRKYLDKTYLKFHILYHIIYNIAIHFLTLTLNVQYFTMDHQSLRRS